MRKVATYTSYGIAMIAGALFGAGIVSWECPILVVAGMIATLLRYYPYKPPV